VRSRSGASITAAGLQRAIRTALPSFWERFWEYQFEQREDGDVLVHVVPRQGFDEEAAAALGTAMTRFVGGDVRFRVLLTDAISRDASGKRPLIKRANGAPDGPPGCDAARHTT